MTSAGLWLVPVCGIATIVFTTLLIAHEMGVQAGRRLLRTPDGEEVEGVGAAYLAAGLGLLALLIGFSFGMSVDRFNSRRLHVSNEANAITTAYRRLEMLEASQSTPLRQAMMPYLTAREAFSRAADNDEISATEAQSEATEQQLWLAIVRTVDPAQHPGRAVVDSSIAMFDLAAARSAAIRGVIPKPILFALLLYAAIVAAFMGYSHAYRPRQFLASTVQFALLSISFCIIFDLDRPRSGLVQVSQQPILHSLAWVRAEQARLEAQVTAPSAPAPTT